MGAAAGAGLSVAIAHLKEDELSEALKGLPEAEREKIKAAVMPANKPVIYGGPMMSSLRGRWVSKSESGADGMMTVEVDGEVTVFGEDEKFQLQEPAFGQFILVSKEDGSEMGKASLSEDGAAMNWDDGEVWSRVQNDDGSPRRVPRKQGTMTRNLTKEPIASDSAAEKPAPTDG